MKSDNLHLRETTISRLTKIVGNFHSSTDLSYERERGGEVSRANKIDGKQKTKLK